MQQLAEFKLSAVSAARLDAPLNACFSIRLKIFGTTMSLCNDLSRNGATSGRYGMKIFAYITLHNFSSNYDSECSFTSTDLLDRARKGFELSGTVSFVPFVEVLDRASVAWCLILVLSTCLESNSERNMFNFAGYCVVRHHQ